MTEELEDQNQTQSSSLEDTGGDEPRRRSRRRGRRGKSRESQAGQDPVQPEPEEVIVSPPDPEPVPAPLPPPPPPPKATEFSRFLAPGFADGLDRKVCAASVYHEPHTYPVQHRHGVAVMPLRVVAIESNELLLCNLLHKGVCVWPDGLALPQDSSQDMS